MSATPANKQTARRRFVFLPWNRLMIYACALFVVFWSVGPFLWQMSTSLQLDKNLVSGNPTLIPDPITFDHFINIFVGKSFHRYLLNSVIVAGTTTFLCLLFGAIAAFALARLEIRGRFGILGFILAVSMFPQIPIVAPLYVLASQFAWLTPSTILVFFFLSLALPF